MLVTILGALAPVFGLILLGWWLGRIDLMGGRAFEVLNRLVIAVTLPVLTFRTLATMRASDLAMPSMVIAVLGGAFVAYGVGYAIERAAGRTAAEANIAGLAGSFSNTGFIGLTIALLAFGPPVLGPVAVAMALYAAVVFGVGIFLSELTVGEGGVVVGMRRAGRAMTRNPLILLSVLGVGWAWLGLPLSGPIDTFLAMLAGATAPCALIAVGLFIALPRQAAAPAPIARVVAMKLVGHPLATWTLVLVLPAMPWPWGAMAVLMAAMPSGSSSFVLAGGAGRWAMELSAWTVVLTTTLAAVTLGPFIWLLHP